MNKTISISTALSCLCLALPGFACEYPQRADVPNGSTASKEEMIAGQKSVKEYMTAMETYLSCLEDDEKSAIADMPDLTDEERATRDAALTKKYNAAVEEMEVIAARFNEEVRAYKAQSQ